MSTFQIGPRPSAMTDETRTDTHKLNATEFARSASGIVVDSLSSRAASKDTNGPHWLVSGLRRYWFLIGLAVSIVLAYCLPDVARTGGLIRAEWTVKWGCVILIFFISGLSLRTRQLGKELLRVRLHCVVQVCSLLIMPSSVYVLVRFLMRYSLNKHVLVGLIIMSSTSTTISSNVVMTKNALGNEYAALLNAVVGNLLGIFVSPALIFYFLRDAAFESLANRNDAGGQLNYGRVIQNLVFTVLVPLLVGQIVHLTWTERVTRLKEKFYFAELNSLALLALVWSVFSTAFANKSFANISNTDLLVLLVINVFIYSSFSLFILAVARLPIPYWQFARTDAIAMTFCAATKTLAMGIPLINALYGTRNEQVVGILSLPLIVYHVQQLVLGAVQVILFKRWREREIEQQRRIGADGNEQATPLDSAGA
jgi:solute carrier family 10 (sodium/bile acid cotransporter), member 7